MTFRNEAKIMSPYFDKTSAVSIAFDILREDYLKKTGLKAKKRTSPLQRLTKKLTNEAKNEVQKTRLPLDRSTFPFAQDLNHYIYGFEPTHSIMLVDGIFYSEDQKIRSIIPIDLGINPFMLFQGHQSIDACVTDQKTKDFLLQEKVRKNLLRQGFGRFDITSSRFFYIPENELSDFYEEKTKNNEKPKLDMSLLVPLISYVPQMIVTDQPIRIGKEDYIEIAPKFVSYRLKQSLEDKAIARISSTTRLTSEDEISDWAAHRALFKSEEAVFELYESLKKLKSSTKHNSFGRNSGSQLIDIVQEKNCYAKPSLTGYKGLNLRIVVKTGKHQPLRRELIMTSKHEYYDNEISLDMPQSRCIYEQEKHRIEQNMPEEHKKLLEDYRSVLTQIFGKSITSINLIDGTVNYAGCQSHR